ncbi:unnamed protein product, partial [Amoebophrya sp. A25]
GHLAFRYRDVLGSDFLFGGNTVDPASIPFCEVSVVEQAKSVPVCFLLHSLMLLEN